MIAVDYMKRLFARDANLVAQIPEEAWEELTRHEQVLVFAIDDYKRGRFDVAELRRRLHDMRQQAKATHGR